MSLYNMVNGVNPCTFFILPMLGKHPEEYPRFRDCFLSDPDHPEYDDKIHLYARIGGGNRDDYESEIEELRAHPEYITDHDDDFDCTYATFVFRVPEKWLGDFNKIMGCKWPDVSSEYRSELYRIFPKLKDKLDEIFKTGTSCA